MVQKVVSVDNRIPTDLTRGTCLIGTSYGSNQSGQDGLGSENNYSRTLTSLMNPVVELHWFNDTTHSWAMDTTGVVETLGIPQFTFSDSVFSAQELRALERLVGQVRGHNWAPAVDLAELDQTIELARSTVLRFARSYRALRSRDVSGAIRHLFGNHPQGVKQPTRLRSRSVSGQWLEMQYGWLPLMSSIHEAMLYHRSRERKSVQRFRARWSQSGTIGWGGSGILSVPGYCYRRGQILWFVEAVRGSELEQLGFTNPSQVLWEKIPFSFVVDWFLPIGSYLDVRNYVSLIVGKQVRSGKTYGTVTGLPVYDTSGNNSYLVGNGFRYKYLYFTRYVSPISQSDVPLLATFDAGGLRGKRIFNAVALAHQVLRR